MATKLFKMEFDEVFNEEEVYSCVKKVATVLTEYIETIYNYRSLKGCDINSFIGKIIYLFFMKEYTKVLQMEEEKGGDVKFMSGGEQAEIMFPILRNKTKFIDLVKTELKENEETFHEEIFKVFPNIVKTSKAPPVFFISEELLELFFNTDLPNDLSFLSDYYSELSFFIPEVDCSILWFNDKGRFCSNPDKKNYHQMLFWRKVLVYCRFLGDQLIVNILHGLDSDSYPLIEERVFDLKNIHDSDLTVAKMAEKIGESDISSLKSKGLNNLVKIFNRIAELGLNVLLYSISINHFPFDQIEVTEQLPKKRRKKREGSSIWGKRTPYLMGINGFGEYSFNFKTNKQSMGNGESGITISPHFRRGHWRCIPTGKGRVERVVRWIRPTYVNAAKQN